MTNTAKLKKLIKKHNLAAREQEILGLAVEALELATTPASKLRTGVTKFGGDPDLPAGTPWPKRGKRPLTFIAQINLKDIAAAPVECYWPHRSGLLSFFYDVAEQPWGGSPKDRDGWRILYTPAGKAVKSTPAPAWTGRSTYGGGPLKQCAVSFRKVLTIPAADNLLTEHVLVRKQDQKRYLSLYLEYADPIGEFAGSIPAPRHQWGGWPIVIQNDMEMNCQMLWHGVEDPLGVEKWNGRGTPQMDPRFPYLAGGAARWTLVLQVASDDNLGVMFGDVGNIYFYATAETIAMSEFREVWVELQCT